MKDPKDRVEEAFRAFFAEHGFTGPDVNEIAIQVFSGDPLIADMTGLRQRIIEAFEEDWRTGRKY